MDKGKDNTNELNVGENADDDEATEPVYKNDLDADTGVHNNDPLENSRSSENEENDGNCMELKATSNNGTDGMSKNRNTQSTPTEDNTSLNDIETAERITSLLTDYDVVTTEEASDVKDNALKASKAELDKIRQERDQLQMVVDDTRRFIEEKRLCSEKGRQEVKMKQAGTRRAKTESIKSYAENELVMEIKTLLSLERERCEKEQMKKRSDIEHKLETAKSHNSMILTEKDGEIKKLKQQVKRLADAHSKLKQDLVDKKAKYDDQLLANRELATKKFNLQKLSKLAGAHLTSDNPNIADLSDENRPTKIAEKFSELYDNEWIDAYEELCDKWELDERTSVNEMMRLLKAANRGSLAYSRPYREVLDDLQTVTVKIDNKSSKDKATQTTDIADLNKEYCCLPKDGSVKELDRKDNDTKQAHQEKVYPKQLKENIPEHKDEVDAKRPVDTEEILHEISGRANIISSHAQETMGRKHKENEIKDECNEYTTCIKVKSTTATQPDSLENIAIPGKFMTCVNTEEVIAQKVAFEVNHEYLQNPTVMAFIQKCAEQCWFMAMQEPPVVVGFETETEDVKFDEDRYKAYTKKGKKLDFVVWPPLYLHMDGPMLCKGIAQGKD